MDNSTCRYKIDDFAQELGVDVAGISGLFASYIEEMKEESESMRNFYKKEDWHMLQRVVHNIKGVSANLGIMDVFSEAEKFDILLKSDITQNSDVYIEKITGTIDKAEEEIRKFFEQHGVSI